MDQLAIQGGTPVIQNTETHYIWPRITESVKSAILGQLDESISIYNRSGIFERFEDAFIAYHNNKQPYALVQNSGTTALWSMYVGAQVGPGDEVIVPSYTFYATYSPLMWTGATPIFVDSNEEGNIDANLIEEKITPNTKAVVVSHMWGLPCDMPHIREICDKHNILLLEDCSHAHGAEINGQKVGTYGDAAVWSLQGQKIVTGGEGGILLTRNEELFYRAVLLGQYNKRAKQQIPAEHPLYKYTLTGFGLKLRAHPLAIAMAYEQFTHLDEWLNQKAEYANMFYEGLQEFPFLHLPNVENRKHAWYAFVVRFDESMTGVETATFVKALHAEGLKEADQPGSTCPNHNLPIFTTPNEILPHLYTEQLPNQGPFPVAEKFFKEAIKFPVWAYADERHWVESYIEGIRKVAKAIEHDPSELQHYSN